MESKNNKQKGINAVAWMANLSTHGHIDFTRESSDHAASPKYIVAEHWDGTKWCERRLEWNGQKYMEVSK